MASDLLELLRERIEARELEGLGEVVVAIHPADLAELMMDLEPQERTILFRQLPTETATQVVRELDEEVAGGLLASAEAAVVKEIFEELPTDDAADLLSELSSTEVGRILGGLEAEERADLRALLQFPADSAGGVMTAGVLAVREEMIAEEAIAAIRRQGREHEVEGYLSAFVVAEDHVLKGAVTFHQLILADPQSRVGDLVQGETVKVSVHADQEDVARVMAKYNLVVMPVVDEFGRLVGRITADDVFEILEEETTEDLLLLAGADDEEAVWGGPVEAIRSRLPWLSLNLFTAFLAAGVVSLFKGTIQEFVILAVWMPVIAGMGGNGGTQALAVTVRRLVLGGIDRQRGWKIIRKEALVGVVNGLVIGGIVAVVAILWNQSPLLGLIVGLAMWLNLTVAGMAGALIPLTLQRLGLDPAVASSVFVTTLTDIGGFFFLLGLATLFIVYLV